jgi:peptidoglycan/xylan/chitin deacetylase (PgdA/CDA1 family)
MGAAPVKILVRVIMLSGFALALLGTLAWAALEGPASGRLAAAMGLSSAIIAGVYLAWLYLPDVDLPGRSPRRGLPSPSAPRAALTFDDGPNGADTAAVLDALRRHGARATFFVVGEAARKHPELVRRMIDEGHVVGSHTDRHTKLPWLSRAAVERELDDASAAIVAAGAPRPAWFRAPHGFKSPFLPGALRRRGMRMVAWTHGVWDTDRPGAEVIAERAIGCLVDREILLLHDGTLGADRSQTADALEHILAGAAERRIELVTVPEILQGAGQGGGG